MMRFCLLVACSLASIVPAVAETGALPDSMMGENGTCKSLVALGHDFTPSCKGFVMNTVFTKLHRTGFYFVAKNVIITFSGDANQIKPDPDTAIQPLDRLILSFNGKTDAPYTAVGTCRFTNPYAGPAIVKCHAETDKGVFDADFLSDGNAPKRMK